MLQFDEKELELLISGTPDIDVDDWRSATEYHGYTASDSGIVWWWRALKSFSRADRAKVLSFATGTAKVPLGGFAELPVSATRMYRLAPTEQYSRVSMVYRDSRFIKITGQWIGCHKLIHVSIRVCTFLPRLGHSLTFFL